LNECSGMVLVWLGAWRRYKREDEESGGREMGELS
jgi:hypothetical protein